MRRSVSALRPRWEPAALLLLVGLAAPPEGRAQDPPPPDTVVAPDTLQVRPDTLQAAPDTLDPDTVFYNLPDLERGTPPGFATGIWEWDRDDIMARGANTLAELMADLPGLLALVGGDYGTPVAVSAFGLGAGGVRVYRDGFEAYPLEGGVANLQHIGLAGISRVRLDRSPGAMRIDLWSHRHDDGRPLSVIEAGTGDLDTNVLRAIFAEPTALWGSIALGIERVDTRGLAADEGGNRTGSWLRYQLHLKDRAGLAVDFRRMGSQTRVPDYALSLSRTDIAVRARAEIVPGVVVEAYTGRSSLDADDAGEAYELWGGRRTQHGARLSLRSSGLWASGEARLFGGDLPERTLDVAGGYAREGWGGLSGHFRGGRWSGSAVSSGGGRVWVGPLLGVTLFGSWESGTFGGRDAPVLDGTAYPPPPAAPVTADPPPAALFTERSALRGGASVSVLGATLSGAALLLDVDSHLPLAHEPDLGAQPVPGATRVGLEAWVSLPTPLEGLQVEGSYQRWDEEGVYLPQEIYRGSLEFHRIFLESGNFELWWSIGVRGHDPMQVFVDAEAGGGVQRVPFYQLWYARVQARIVTVRLFIGWENFVLRRNLQTYPGRVLPAMRSFFGLRWDMWS